MRKIVFLSQLLIVIAASFTTVIAQKKTTIQFKGLKAAVEVWRDEWGMNHIYANNQQDLFFAQGYCAAKDRLFQVGCGDNLSQRDAGHKSVE